MPTRDPQRRKEQDRIRQQRHRDRKRAARAEALAAEQATAGAKHLRDWEAAEARWLDAAAKRLDAIPRGEVRHRGRAFIDADPAAAQAHFDETSALVRERAGGRCELCGEPMGADVTLWNLIEWPATAFDLGDEIAAHGRCGLRWSRRDEAA